MAADTSTRVSLVLKGRTKDEWTRVLPFGGMHLAGKDDSAGLRLATFPFMKISVGRTS